MILQRFLLLSSLLLYYALLSTADVATPRAYLGCSLVLNQIYCYGGYVPDSGSNGTQYNTLSSNFYSLDMSSFDFNGNVSTAQNNWTTITNTVGANLLIPLGFHSTAGISGQSKFLMYGGVSNTAMNNPIVMYDPPSRTWSSVPIWGNYSDQTAIVDLSQTQSLWTWGGNVNSSTTVAPNIAYIFNYGISQWTNVPGDTQNTNVRYSYTATLGNNNRIYMIGGFEDQPGAIYATPATNMLQVRWYDTVSKNWGTDQATIVNSNLATVSQRAYHTTTQIPGSNKFLVYGGSVFIGSQNTIPNDYAYTYDYVAKQYSLLNLGTGGAGRRSGHQAVAYKSYIFILFGFDDLLLLRNDINVLDVSNATNPVWVTPNRNSTNPTGSSNPTSSNTESASSRISQGTTAGIAVAAAIVGIAIFAGILFLVYRRKQKQRQFELEDLDPRAHQRETWADDLPTHYQDGNQDNMPQKASYAEDTLTSQSEDYTRVGYVKPTSNDKSESTKPYANE
ncbi:uncharacterized protein BX664DRAFT_352981 [Halteromyces radiatus]|uniref:uncharacterized protein n=1 Tax=Halteromyces radiatus TaxID=101107 RepID=UPI00221E64CC|nr:uncharacterized protein BX664DRAFT_352981 [Halteromyces radiatus]KAI8079818.1 hypothetical protein BX664DRAFT_352981 [Halteromyces radiatus]